MNAHHANSIFQTCFDVVVIGTGFAGYAAAMRLKEEGKRVLLVGQRSDMLWEAGRAFHPLAGQSDDPMWQSLVGKLQARNGHHVSETQADHVPWFDGAQCEILSTEEVVNQSLDVLYYVSPAAVELVDGNINAIVVATKAGYRRIVAGQWIDATENASLLRLAQPQSSAALPLRQPDRLLVHLYLQHMDWVRVATDINLPDLRPTAWPTERVLSLAVAPEKAVQASWRFDALDKLDELANCMGQAIGEVIMSHWSIEPFPDYDARPADRSATKVTPVIPSNLAMASPGWSSGAIHTLADRWQLGLAAAKALGQQPHAAVSKNLFDQPLPDLHIKQTLQADIAIIGAGTGGSVAAVAAARADQTQLPDVPGQPPLKIIAIEPMAFPGGIGTGGGIHAYFFGVPGGLQREIDQLTRELMNRYQTPLGCGLLGSGPFNPWAKTLVFQKLFAEHHVELLLGATLVQTHTRSGRIESAILVTDDGMVRLEAPAWIDGTGDGDLCALAGASFTLGREHDGLLHAYTQSTGLLREVQGQLRMTLTNLDAGFCDPTDPEDLTRARLEGIRQKVVGLQDNIGRTTYVAPAIGLRQGRQIDTQYTLTFNDQFNRKRFKDSIGYSGCFSDSHATDYEFQSDDALFWARALGQRPTPLAYEMSYRMIVPRGLDNVWIASRCLGVSQDAHQACRMQRDIQRIGEAAGIAAVLALRNKTTATTLDTAALRKLLEQNGAFDKAPKGLQLEFGRASTTELLDAPQQQIQAEAAAALASLDQAVCDDKLWWLYCHANEVRPAVLERLTSSNSNISWLAACVAAMWGEPAAEPRLLQAIATLEYGFADWLEPSAQAQPGVNSPAVPKPKGPMSDPRLAPRWLVAAGLLRRCGTAACLPVLASLVNRPTHSVNAMTTISLTLERLAVGLGLEGQQIVHPMLDQMTRVKLVGMYEYPQRNIGKDAHLAVLGHYDDPSHHDARPEFGQTFIDNIIEDNTWQYHLALARARLAWGMAPQAGAAAYLEDPRSLVRNAMSQALQQQATRPIALPASV